MPVPPEYTDARNNLTAFRTKILNDLVSARVKAGLDANHDTMTKYKAKIDALSVTPYLFGRVSEKALALRLKGKDLGSGEIHRVGASWIGDVSLYPNKPPLNIEQRNLMQVDEFVYTLMTDLDWLRKTDTANLRSAVLVQVASDTFSDSPHAENFQYDYYEFVPIEKLRGGWEIQGGLGWGAEYPKIKGEQVVMVAHLYKKGTLDNWLYYVYLWLDATNVKADGSTRLSPVLYEIWRQDGALDVVYNVCGKRTIYLINNFFGIGTIPPFGYSGMEFMFGEQPLGIKTLPDAEDFPVSVWKNEFEYEIQVNDETMGETNPPAGTKDKIAGAGVRFVQGFPNAGYGIDHWERNGAVISYANNVSVVIYRDTVIKCVFKKL